MIPDLPRVIHLMAKVRPPRPSRRSDLLWTRMPRKHLYEGVSRLRTKADMAAYVRARVMDGLRPVPAWAQPEETSRLFTLGFWAQIHHPGWFVHTPNLTPAPVAADGAWQSLDLTTMTPAPVPAPWAHGVPIPDAAAPEVRGAHVELEFPDSPPITERGAEGKARGFLREFLTMEQRLEYLTSKAFTVTASDGVRFRVNDGNGGRKIEELDASGKVLERWCLVADPLLDGEADGYDAWPKGDELLTQKLLLETDVAEFRRLAIRTLPPREDFVLPVVRLMCYLFDNATSVDVWDAVLRATKIDRPTVVRVAA